MTAGSWVVIVGVLLATALGVYRRTTDGRARRTKNLPSADADILGVPPSAALTFVQFSSPTCAPCRSTHRLLADMTANDGGLAFVEIDATENLDIARRFDIYRTPTVLAISREGALAHRIVGAPRRAEVLELVRQARG